MTRRQPGAQHQAITAVVFLCAALLQAAVLPVDNGNGLTETLLINTCPHCITVGDRQLANRLKVEAIKQQILSKLSLQEKPNITAPVPREVALEALRRIQSTLPGEHSIQPLGDDAGVGSNQDRDDYYGRTSEIIAFAEPGSSLNGHVLLDFYHPHEHAHRLRVTKATLWIQLRYSSNLPRHLRQMLWDHSVTLYVFRVQTTNMTSTVSPNDSLPLKMLTSHKVTTSHAGWRRIEIGSAVQQWFSSPGRDKLTLLVDCVGCDSRLELVLFNETKPPSNLTSNQLPRRLRHSNGHNLRPFLAIATEMIRPRRTRRHAVTCDSQTTQCCKQTLYVSFRELGWADWIIAPKGYYANYCMGDCASTRRPPDTFVSFHTHIIEEYRNRNPYASITPCCAPTKLSSMSLIYFDPDMNIIKTDLPKMIVDECGCT